MKNVLFQTSKKRFDKAYFNFRDPWFFNSPDILPFAYILLGILIGLCLSCLILIFLWGGMTTSDPQVNVPSNQEAAQNTFVDESSSSEELSPLVKNAQKDRSFEERFQQAKTQPTYDLKIQALLKLSESPEISVEQKESIQAQKKAYAETLSQAQKKYLAIEQRLEKEHYSIAIKMSKELIDQGKILGVLYDNAQDSFEKAHYRKIAYFLKTAQLSKAKKALEAAKTAGISADKLSTYEKQIASLSEIQ